MDFDPQTDMKPETLHKKLQKNDIPIIIDVRSEEQFNSWTILHSQNFPIKEIREKGSVPFSKETPLVTVCNRGNSSRKAAALLRDLGYNAISLYKGMGEWNTVLDPIDIKIENSDLKVTQIRRIAKGCLSYIVSLDGEAAIIDPAFELDSYMDIIDEMGVDVKYVLDTHLHADHVSGARKLAEKTGATLLLSDKDPHNFEFKPIKNNQAINLGGKPVITALSTPGHTSGSTTYRIKDLGLLTGDVLFVDGIGRPDLAEKAETFAHDLYQTLTEKIVTLPKNLFVAPAHHGKFAQLHFNEAIISTIEERLKSKVFEYSEEEFIEYAVNSATSSSKPPSYETIININTGNLSMSEQEVKSLEAGPNRCAI